MALVKSLQLEPDPSAISRSEFAISMHLIVCRTKRGLSKLPLQFPNYLFPQLSTPSWTRPTNTDTRLDSHDRHPFNLIESMGSAFVAARVHPEKMIAVPDLIELSKRQV